MNIHTRFRRPMRRFLGIATLSFVVMATATAAAVAQGYGAQQAVRQRVQGLEGGPVDSPASPSPQDHAAPGDQPLASDPSAGTPDSPVAPPNTAAVVVLSAAPGGTESAAALLPTGVTVDGALRFLGIDPAAVEGVVGFVDFSNPASPTYAATIRFKEPFRASAIPPHARPYVQLSELAGRKYLQSTHPVWPSFYGTDNRTLIVAPDATLRQIVSVSGM